MGEAKEEFWSAADIATFGLLLVAIRNF